MTKADRLKTRLALLQAEMSTLWDQIEASNDDPELWRKYLSLEAREDKYREALGYKTKTNAKTNIKTLTNGPAVSAASPAPGAETGATTRTR